MTEYGLADWTAEVTALHVARQAPPQCPKCGRTGFYGPRWDARTRRYRACKFCGLWQDVSRPPHLVIRYECHHADGSSVADWKEPQESWTCPVCRRNLGPSEAVPWPVDVPGHPWWTVPQGMTYTEACDYFEQHDGTRKPHI